MSRVFLSYSHDSDEHGARVLALAERLVGDGLDCALDVWEPHPAEGWPQWMDRQLDAADFVLVVCTAGYYQKAKAGKRPRSGKGVKFESVLIVSDLYDAGMWNETFIPVLFADLPAELILRPLRTYTRYRVDREDGYEDLLRHLTGQPRRVRPPLGRVPPLPPEPPLVPAGRSAEPVIPPGFDPRVERLFVGREPELAQLAAALLGAEAPRPVAICSLQGMPGVGKSYLAERFAVLHRDRFPGGSLRLALDPALDPEGAAPVTAESLLADLADRLKVPPAPAGLAEGVRERLLLGGFLLHVENVDSAPLARAAAELVRCLAGCPVVVSGRVQRLGESLGWPQVRVRPFAEDVALEQLEQELGPEVPREGAEAYRRLVQALGGLPLAVHLAAGHLNAGRTVDGFLAKLHGTRFDLHPADPGEATRTLARTFTLSLDLLRSELGAAGDRLLAGFLHLGHAPAAGFGASLGAALCDLPDLGFEDLAVTACRLSMLEAIPPAERQDRAYRLHPLLAELLRDRGGPEAEARALARTTDWFCARLPKLPYGQEDEQGRRWKEVQAETPALLAWLPRVPADDRVRVERAGSKFAIYNGPFHAWSAFCEELLTQPLEDAQRSDALWTLGQVARRAGDLDRAASTARTKGDLDRARGDEHEAALAAGLLADVLQARGELEEALRIRREEQIPVYERLGDVRERAVTLGKIADVLQARGELEEALRIRREEEIPVYERLGDVRERAVTLGRIADVLREKGELEEALRIPREEQLPVYERLGLAFDLIRGRANLALTYLKRNQDGDRETATGLLHLALRAASAMRLPEAETIRAFLRKNGLPADPEQAPEGGDRQ